MSEVSDPNEGQPDPSKQPPNPEREQAIAFFDQTDAVATLKAQIAVALTGEDTQLRALDQVEIMKSAYAELSDEEKALYDTQSTMENDAGIAREDPDFSSVINVDVALSDQLEAAGGDISGFRVDYVSPGIVSMTRHIFPENDRPISEWATFKVIGHKVEVTTNGNQIGNSNFVLPPLPEDITVAAVSEQLARIKIYLQELAALTPDEIRARLGLSA